MSKLYDLDSYTEPFAPDKSTWHELTIYRDYHACQYPDCYNDWGLVGHHLLTKGAYVRYMFLLCVGIALCPLCHTSVHNNLEKEQILLESCGLGSVILQLKAAYHGPESDIVEIARIAHSERITYKVTKNPLIRRKVFRKELFA